MSTWWWFCQAPWIATLIVPLSYFVAWAWVSRRSERLGLEAAKALLIAVPLTLLLAGSALAVWTDGVALVLEHMRP